MDQLFTVRFGAMACDCEIMLAARDEAEAQARAQPAIDEVRRIETKYSRYRTDSLLARIHADAGRRATPVDEETASLLAYADALYRTSGGAFDITSGVLRRAWNFRTAHVPTDAELDEVLPLVGWHQVERTDSSVYLRTPGMELDFGGFGKEYAADRAAAALSAQGVAHGYVNLGGDLRTVGPQPDGSPWEVGIQDPRSATDTIAAIALRGGALASSGDYERYMEVDGVRHCHILNPRTGRSCTWWRSVSVVAPLAVAAGSLATLAMLKGEDGLAFLRESGHPFFAVDHTGAVHRRDA
ncbi:FAD:protein FMN transferase [Massilia arenosa]|uniref:FAD:protein FMN transferase n=1 Tax=Zemynaea arenosa TaxID=2561931 RepID=A0A4Y9RP91_9BURK|nr:FAD:protein FMN transferase [Massilia arenosa]TFW10682.1 FAD:protein FMN transferase [Massilia arenosa]